MKPAMRQLARCCRAITYSLCGDRGSGARVDPSIGFDNYVRQLDAVLDRARLERAAICGVSFGGFVAVRYAAVRPDRVSALILASAPGPGFSPSVQQARWLKRPWISAPVFVATAPARVWPEIRSAFSSWTERLSFAAMQTLRVIAAPLVPGLMAQRMRLAEGLDYARDVAGIRSPVLVITGDDGLDRVVPVRSTQRFTQLIPGARYEIMHGTGHMGILTQPEKFARIVCEFVHGSHR
jgi:pimeloyl-ACP methyl ester carboxylesterase